MGILPERGHRPGSGDSVDPVPDGPSVAELLVLARTTSQRHRRLHVRRFHGRGDYLGGQRVVNEVISGMRLQKFCDARLCILQTLNSLDPNRPGVRKITEDIVGLVHIPPLSVPGKLPHREKTFLYGVQLSGQWYGGRPPQAILHKRVTGSFLRGPGDRWEDM